jgi:hypothetical protein
VTLFASTDPISTFLFSMQEKDDFCVLVSSLCTRRISAREARFRSSRPEGGAKSQPALIVADFDCSRDVKAVFF